MIGGVARLDGVDPTRAEGPQKAAFEAQTRRWGKLGAGVSQVGLP